MTVIWNVTVMDLEYDDTEKLGGKKNGYCL